MEGFMGDKKIEKGPEKIDLFRVFPIEDWQDKATVVRSNMTGDGFSGDFVNWGSSPNITPRHPQQRSRLDISHHHWGQEKKWVVANFWAPRQKPGPLERAHCECQAGPEDIFCVCVPLSASTHNRKDNEIFILSDVRPHGQGSVIGSFNDHNSRTQPGCEGWAPFPV